MIFVKRTAAPAYLTDPAGAVAAEKEKARAFYQAAIPAHREAVRKYVASSAAERKKMKAPRPPNFKFDSFSHDDVKDALAELFHKKCAYCESFYTAVITGDVEHYRPKGLIKNADTGDEIWPGYYWLALEWDNLLPSCTICNQTNIQLDLTHSGTGTERTLGKLNWFPLEDEKNRAVEEGDHSNEKPLLLNPCKHDPVQHLEFVDRHGHAAVLGTVTKEGEQTVHILGLNRFDLVHSRKRKLTEMEGVMADVRSTTKLIADSGALPGVQQQLIVMLREKTRTLEAFMNPDREYSALASQVVPKFIAEMKTLVT